MFKELSNVPVVRRADRKKRIDAASAPQRDSKVEDPEQVACKEPMSADSVTQDEPQVKIEDTAQETDKVQNGECSVDAKIIIWYCPVNHQTLCT